MSLCRCDNRNVSVLKMCDWTTNLETLGLCLRELTFPLLSLSPTDLFSFISMMTEHSRPFRREEA